MNFTNSNYIELLKRITKWSLLSLGSLFLIIIILAFTEQPFWWYYNLGKSNSTYRFKPETFILLGGAGMPSESNLIRAYYTVEMSKKHPNSNIIIALPEDSIEEISSLFRLRRYLIENGVDSTRISTENQGKNTRQQALNILKLFPQINKRKTVIITSPEHMYRSIACFKKLNFNALGGEPCFENAMETNILYDDNDLEGRKNDLIIGKNIQLRYQFWNHLKYQVLVYREFTAFLYYKIRGWA